MNGKPSECEALCREGRAGAKPGVNVIIIAGMPASGKSTFAARLGRELGYPILEKDAIKEALFDTVGFRSYAEKRRLDTAATSVLLRCAEALLNGGQSMILVNNFCEDRRPQVEALLRRHDCACILVFFGGDGDAFYRRYVERDLVPSRHLGHILQERYPPQPGDALSHTMTREEFADKFEKLGMAAFQIDGAIRLDVDATHPERIHTAELIGRIRKLL